MAGFTENRATHGRIGHPVGAGDPGRIDATVKHGRTSAPRQLFLQSYVRWRKTTVEADGQMLATIFNSGPEFTAFIFRQRHWFFEEYMLSCA